MEGRKEGGREGGRDGGREGGGREGGRERETDTFRFYEFPLLDVRNKCNDSSAQ